MNEDFIRKIIREEIFFLFYEMFSGELKTILPNQFTAAVEYIEKDCVCANYNQKHRTELIKKMTGKNKNFKYSGA